MPYKYALPHHGMARDTTPPPYRYQYVAWDHCGRDSMQARRTFSTSCLMVSATSFRTLPANISCMQFAGVGGNDEHDPPRHVDID